MTLIERRRFLRGLGAGAAAGLLAACTSGSTPDRMTSAARSSEPSSAPSSALGYFKHVDVIYAPVVDRAHLMDVYVPTTGAGPFPVVIFQSGSAFLSDDTKSGAVGGPPGLPAITTAAGLARMWAPHGYAVVGLNVRSSAQAVFPAQVYDIKAAIRYLRANAASLNLDPHRFATMGTSSGAWVTTMAGVTGGVSALEGDLGNAGQSSAVQAVIDLFGPTDFLQMDAHRVAGGQLHDPASSPESRLMGFALPTNPAAVERANPCTYVTHDSPSIFISHGSQDVLVPPYESQLLFEAYQRASASATFVLVPGVSHTDSYLASGSAASGCSVMTTAGGRATTSTTPTPKYPTLLAFLDQHLK